MNIKLALDKIIFRLKNWKYYKMDRRVEGFWRRDFEREVLKEKLKKLMKR